MSRGRRLGLALGLVLVAGGLAVAIAPGLGSGIQPNAAILTGVGVTALVLAGLAVRARFNATESRPELPAVERPQSYATPGDGLDRQLAAVGAARPSRGARERRAIRERLEATAVAVLVRDGLSEGAAREALAGGTWTDDPHAAAFFADDPGEDVSLATQLRLSFSVEPTMRRRARHAIDALARRAGRAVMRGSSSARDAYEELDPNETVTRRTERWRGVSALALVAGAAGVLANQPALVVAGTVGVAFAALARAASPPDVALALERSVSDADPEPDDSVTVTVEVTNVGESTLPDLRLIDGVPPGLAVESGSPRLGTALRSGESATFSYDVTATRGAHAFEPALAVARDVSGTAECARRIRADATPITCVPTLAAAGELPLRAQTTGQPGRVLTEIGGSGVAFHTTREYRPGDPLSRIDWNGLAKTGELATVDFREERAASIVLLIDAREEAYRAPSPDAESAVERSVRAVRSLYDALTSEENRVGIAALSPEPCWLAPGVGTAHRARVQELLATHPALAPTPPDRPFYPSIRTRRLRRRLPEDAQLVVCSPLCDDSVVRLLQRLDAAGHRVTVVSPDPTGRETSGRRLAAVERRLRLSRLRSASIPALDWRDEPLATALARAGGSG
ncbi:DUF58 domain-containing protein [Halococcus agarilyticus]|uniref:DUF58 domain-containing protein n=1 Tax=Halococcus agarilyticus TaxID=1232219 RepID=UPI001E554EC0|nr:DUF58 domain-containing protein [Halococcus agarilyticus]